MGQLMFSILNSDLCIFSNYAYPSFESLLCSSGLPYMVCFFFRPENVVRVSMAHSVSLVPGSLEMLALGMAFAWMESTAVALVSVKQGSKEWPAKPVLTANMASIVIKVRKAAKGSDES